MFLLETSGFICVEFVVILIFRSLLMAQDLHHVVEDLRSGMEEIVQMICAQSPIDFSLQVINQDFKTFSENLNQEYKLSKEKEYRYCKRFLCQPA